MARLQTSSSPTPAPATPLEVALRAANHVRLLAELAGDHPVLARLLDEDFRATGADGAWLDGRAFVTRACAARFEAVASEDVTVWSAGAMGIAHGALRAVGRRGLVSRVRFTDVYRWTGVAWRLVAAQLTPCADPRASSLRRGAPPQHAPWEGDEPAGEDGAVLRALNEGYVRAFHASDVAWYDAHLAPEFRAVLGDGSFHDRGAFLALSAAPAPRAGEVLVDKTDVRRFADFAVIHAETPTVLADGRAATARYTDVWLRRAGRWQCVAAHVTRKRANGNIP
jgi:hypothetical protein